MKNESIIKQKEIENRIFTIRGMQVMLDEHLAELYDVGVKVLNQAVKRNARRFPEGFMFQLTSEEWSVLRSQPVTLKTETEIIDAAELYHIGTSMKDLGKSWFAFSRMDSETIELLNQLRLKA